MGVCRAQQDRVQATQAEVGKILAMAEAADNEQDPATVLQMSEEFDAALSVLHASGNHPEPRSLASTPVCWLVGLRIRVAWSLRSAVHWIFSTLDSLVLIRCGTVTHRRMSITKGLRVNTRGTPRRHVPRTKGVG